MDDINSWLVIILNASSRFLISLHPHFSSWEVISLASLIPIPDIHSPLSSLRKGLVLDLLISSTKVSIFLSAIPGNLLSTNIFSD